MSEHRGTLLTFLPLGPVTSNSYPKAQEARPAVEGAAPRRRTSSLTANTGFRVLKVAPVHYGEHGGDHQDDWHPTVAAAPEPAFTFLSLGPVTSNSYPKQQQARPVVEGAAVAGHKRRTSSLSSDGQSGFRVLKVAPVHYGEHGGDHQEDWHEIPEVAVE